MQVGNLSQYVDRAVSGQEPPPGLSDGGEFDEAHGAGGEGCAGDLKPAGGVAPDVGEDDDVCVWVWESALRSHWEMRWAARRAREPTFRLDWMSILWLHRNAGACCHQHCPVGCPVLAPPEYGPAR